MASRASSFPAWIWLLALASLAAYLATLCPTVHAGDSSELVNVCATLGIAHSPGYPLYTLLGHLATLVPIGEVAWRVNAFSALCSALAGAFAAALAWRWTRSRAAAVFAWLVFASAPLVWRSSVVAEVFALGNLLWAALLWLSWGAYSSANRRSWFLGAVIAGLGLAHHHGIVFGSVPLVVAHLVRRSREGAGVWRDLVLALAGFALGLLPLLYLPLRAAALPVMSWGDPASVDGFLHMLLRREAGTFTLTRSEMQHAGPLDGALGFAAAAFENLVWIGAPLALFGLLRTWRSPGAIGFHARVLAIATLAYVLAFSLLGRLDLDVPIQRAIVERFWSWPLVALSLFAAAGAHELAALVRPRFGTRAAAACLVVPIALVFARAPFVVRAESLAGERRFEVAARALLEALPERTLCFSAGDLWTNLLLHEQLVHGVRRDVAVIDRGLLTKPWYARVVARHQPDVVVPPGVMRSWASERTYEYADVIGANLGRREIRHLEVLAGEPLGERWRERYDEIPCGLAACPIERSAADASDTDALLLRGFDDLQALPESIGAPIARQASWELVLVESVERAELTLVRAALAPEHGNRFDERCIELLRRVVARRSDAPLIATHNLIALLARRAQRTSADQAELAALCSRYLERSEPSRQRAEVQRLLDGLRH